MEVSSIADIAGKYGGVVFRELPHKWGRTSVPHDKINGGMICPVIILDVKNLAALDKEYGKKHRS